MSVTPSGTLCLVLLALLLQSPVVRSDYPLRAECEVTPLPDNNGTNASGTISFSQASVGAPVVINFNLSGFPPNVKRGLHIHEYSNPSQKCQSIGPHLNPHNKEHGGPNDTERHLGDIGNIESDSQGYVNYQQVDQLISLSGPNSIAGYPCAIHQGEDDLGHGNLNDSKVTGHSHGKAACGVVNLLERNGLHLLAASLPLMASLFLIAFI